MTYHRGVSIFYLFLTVVGAFLFGALLAIGNYALAGMQIISIVVCAFSGMTHHRHSKREPRIRGV